MNAIMTTQKDRVEKNSPDTINQDIENGIRENIQHYANADKAALSERITKLEKEWYMDRLLITNASALAGMGVLLAATVHKRWLILPSVVLTFLLQHGLQGWCPPLPLFRKLGVRSFKEIDRERFALKYLRGDFGEVNTALAANPEKLFEAVSK
jgi:hypothetical protein